MSTLFETLRADHDRQRTLAGLVARTEGDSRGRQELFPKLVAELRAHAAAEERVFYAELMADELTVEKARHSVAEHKDLDDLIDELSAKDFSSPGWLPRFEKLKHRLLHHLEEEEQEVFQLGGKVLDDDRKSALAETFEQVKAEHLEQERAAVSG